MCLKDRKNAEPVVGEGYALVLKKTEIVNGEPEEIKVVKNSYKLLTK